MSNTQSLHTTFMHILFEFSKLSHCVSKQVAAMAVKDGRIISTGINGTAPGYTNCDDIFNKSDFDRELHNQFSNTYEIHAEMNMILYAAKNGISLDGATLYCSMLPCWNCIKHISVTGIKHIIYAKRYDMLSLEDEKNIYYYCKKLGITIQQFDPDTLGSF